MKKILSLVAISFLWSNVVFALSQSEAIQNFFSKKKLENVEGIWSDSDGFTEAYVLFGNELKIFRISGGSESSGKVTAVLNGYGNNFSGTCYNLNGWSSTGNIQIQFTGVNSGYGKCGRYSFNINRMWPYDLASHNKQFEKKKIAKKPKDKNKVQASSGTAFFVDKKGHLLTNYHVVEGCKDKSKIVYKDKEYKTKLIAKDKYLDLALLKANLNNEY